MNAISRITPSTKAGVRQSHLATTDRDLAFYACRHTAQRRDWHDFCPQWLTRWERRAQVYSAIMAFREGRAPHPGDLSIHRLDHSDSIRLMRTGVVSPFSGAVEGDHVTDFADAQIPAGWRRVPVWARADRSMAA
jgi:hypothetical protein